MLTKPCNSAVGQMPKLSSAFPRFVSGEAVTVSIAAIPGRDAARCIDDDALIPLVDGPVTECEKAGGFAETGEGFRGPWLHHAFP